MVGPYGFGRLADDFPWLRYLTIEDRAGVEPFAELGVLFLLFLIGLELSVARLWSLRRYVAGIGAPAVRRCRRSPSAPGMRRARE